MQKTDYDLLKTIADMDGIPPVGAYNIRKDGAAMERRSTEQVQITPKTDKPGIDIRVMPDVKGEEVHIPVILTKTGMTDLVYNDFYIGENADVTIIAGCGIHNEGCDTAQHDGVHRFFVGRNARIRYVGKRILNPVTELYMEENSYCEMESVQIKGVSSTVRTTKATLAAGAKMQIFERLMTHEDQSARSDVEIYLNGEGASAQIIRCRYSTRKRWATRPAAPMYSAIPLLWTTPKSAQFPPLKPTMPTPRWCTKPPSEESTTTSC